MSQAPGSSPSALHAVLDADTDEVLDPTGVRESAVI